MLACKVEVALQVCAVLAGCAREPGSRNGAHIRPAAPRFSACISGMYRKTVPASGKPSSSQPRANAAVTSACARASPENALRLTPVHVARELVEQRGRAPGVSSGCCSQSPSPPRIASSTRAPKRACTVAIEIRAATKPECASALQLASRVPSRPRARTTIRFAPVAGGLERWVSAWGCLAGKWALWGWRTGSHRLEQMGVQAAHGNPLGRPRSWSHSLPASSRVTVSMA